MTDELTKNDRDGRELVRRGLFDGFEGYRSASKDEYIRVLRGGLIVIDSNVLLDLYRYGVSAREDLLKALGALGDRLFVPHQAVREFWRNREKLLKDPGGTLALQQSLDSTEKQLKELVNNWTNRRSHHEKQRQELAASIADAFGAIRAKVSEFPEDETADWARDTAQDQVLSQLEVVLRSRVGPPMSSSDYDKALEEARRRTEHKIPPGYLDSKKEGDHSTGDYIVWEQALIEATDRRVDGMFVSRDTKEDWIRREGGENRGPRIELIQEMRERAGVQLYIRTPADLLKLAHESLDVDVSDESVTNADLLSKELAASERRYLEDERWWKDSTDWDAAAISWFMERLLAEYPSHAELIDFVAANDQQIDVEVLDFFGMSASFKALRELERIVVEVTEETAREGLVPAQALPLLERVSRRQPGAPTRVVAYRLRPNIAEMIKLAMAARRDLGA